MLSGQRVFATDRLPEYEPKAKDEIQRECLEPAPPAVIALRETWVAESPQDPTSVLGEEKQQEKKRETGGRKMSLKTDDFKSTCEIYFVRELQELQRLPNDGRRGYREPYHLQTGACYIGEWKGNARHGKGTQTWKDGAKFIGHWKDSLAEGNGKFVHADGDVYIGQWRSNAAHGLGIYTAKRGLTRLAGQWAEDCQHGHGVEIWEGGSSYNGQFVWGKKQGHGIYHWPDGSRYSGQWQDNSISGYGQYFGKDGREFRGMWREAVIHGCGCYLWPDGRMFSGQYADDQKQGFGVFTWKDGRRFEGFWHQGKQHGYGSMYNSHGEILKCGIWDMGQSPETPEESPEMDGQSPRRPKLTLPIKKK